MCISSAQPNVSSSLRQLWMSDLVFYYYDQFGLVNLENSAHNSAAQIAHNIIYCEKSILELVELVWRELRNKLL